MASTVNSKQAPPVLRPSHSSVTNGLVLRAAVLTRMKRLVTKTAQKMTICFCPPTFSDSYHTCGLCCRIHKVGIRQLNTPLVSNAPFTARFLAGYFQLIPAWRQIGSGWNGYSLHMICMYLSLLSKRFSGHVTVVKLVTAKTFTVKTSWPKLSGLSSVLVYLWDWG